VKTTETTALVIDNGLFLPLALELGPAFKRVLYQTTHERAFPLINDCVIGDGFEDWNVERCDDFWEQIDEIGLFIFPDIGQSGLQQYLESIGKKVWGSRRGDDLELKRMLLKKTQQEFGLSVPEHKSIKGLDALRSFLKETKNVFVKVSRFRGTSETFHHLDYDHSLPLLDNLAVSLGPLQNEFPFLIEWPIQSELELGFDGYCIDGRFPSIALQGWEKKDKGLIASVQTYDELPRQVTEVNNALASVLKDYSYRNFLSTEIRVKDDEGTMIDITCRAGLPSIESQIELWSNLPEIILGGAQGMMINPEPSAKFAVECMVNHKDDKSRWRILEVPEEAKDSIKPYSACFHDGLYCFPPFPHSSDTVASIVASGDTLESAIDSLKEKAELLSDQPVTVCIDSIYDMLKTIHEAEEEGIEFSSQEIPEPETALE